MVSISDKASRVMNVSHSVDITTLNQHLTYNEPIPHISSKSISKPAASSDHVHVAAASNRNNGTRNETSEQESTDLTELGRKCLGKSGGQVDTGESEFNVQLVTCPVKGPRIQHKVNGKITLKATESSWKFDLDSSGLRDVDYAKNAASLSDTLKVFLNVHSAYGVTITSNPRTALSSSTLHDALKPGFHDERLQECSGLLLHFLHHEKNQKSSSRQTSASSSTVTNSNPSSSLSTHAKSQNGLKNQASESVISVESQQKALEAAKEVKVTFSMVGLQCENPAEAQKLRSLLLNKMSPGKYHNILVLVNPLSGSQRGRSVAQHSLVPMLLAAGIRHNVKFTEHAGQASDIARNIDMKTYAAIVCVGGDGIVHEVWNGLLSQHDWDRTRNFPVGIVPAGSGNGLAKALDIPTPELAAFAVIKACQTPIDLLSVSQFETRANGYQIVRSSWYSHLSISWAFIADCDIGSEAIRWLGPQRTNVWAAWRMMNLRRYKARLRYLPATADLKGKTRVEALAPSNNQRRRRQQHQRKRRSYGHPKSGRNGRKSEHGSDDNGRKNGYSSSGSGESALGSIDTAISRCSHGHPATGPINRHVGRYPTAYERAPWVTLPVASYVYFMACNVTHIAHNYNAAPEAKLNDGFFDLIWINESNTLSMLKMSEAVEDGTYVNFPGVKYQKVRAMVLEPLARHDDGSSTDCSKEKDWSQHSILEGMEAKHDSQTGSQGQTKRRFSLHRLAGKGRRKDQSRPETPKSNKSVPYQGIRIDDGGSDSATRSRDSARGRMGQSESKEDVKKQNCSPSLKPVSEGKKGSPEASKTGLVSSWLASVPPPLNSRKTAIASKRLSASSNGVAINSPSRAYNTAKAPRHSLPEVSQTVSAPASSLDAVEDTKRLSDADTEEVPKSTTRSRSVPGKYGGLSWARNLLKDGDNKLRADPDSIEDGEEDDDNVALGKRPGFRGQMPTLTVTKHSNSVSEIPPVNGHAKADGGIRIGLNGASGKSIDKRASLGEPLPSATMSNAVSNRSNSPNRQSRSSLAAGGDSPSNSVGSPAFKPKELSRRWFRRASIIAKSSNSQPSQSHSTPFQVDKTVSGKMQPSAKHKSKFGIMAVDGEEILSDKIHVESHPALACVMVPPWVKENQKGLM